MDSVNDARNIVSIYGNIYFDILEGKNLEKHRDDVEGAIYEVNKKLEAAKGNDNYTQALLKIKNDLYFLKYEISERI